MKIIYKVNQSIKIKIKRKKRNREEEFKIPNLEKDMVLSEIIIWNKIFEELYITKSINYVFMVFLMLYKIYNKNNYLQYFSFYSFYK